MTLKTEVMTAENSAFTGIDYILKHIKIENIIYTVIFFSVFTVCLVK